MADFQNQQQGTNYPGGQQNQGGQSFQDVPGNTNIPNQEPIKMDNDDVNEIPGEHHNKEGQHDYKNPTGQQDRVGGNKNDSNDPGNNKWAHQNDNKQSTQDNWEAANASHGNATSKQQDDKEVYPDFPDEHQEPDSQQDYKKPVGSYNRGDEDGGEGEWESDDEAESEDDTEMEDGTQGRYQNQNSEREAGKAQRTYSE